MTNDLAAKVAEVFRLIETHDPDAAVEGISDLSADERKRVGRICSEIAATCRAQWVAARRAAEMDDE